MPRLTACGGRNETFASFKIAHSANNKESYIAMLVDSECPVSDITKTWAHLKKYDHWEQPTDAVDEQVLFMTTCMESWIVTDRNAVVNHYGNDLQENALPAIENLESQDRTDICNKLKHATRNCSSPYEKGSHSFKVIGELNPDTLARHLPSFARALDILKSKLGCE